jgi:hypothetical protein
LQQTPHSLHEWIGSWLPDLQQDGSQIAVFPTPERRAVLVDAAKLRADIEYELSRIE